MSTVSVSLGLALAIRVVLVLLFLPFSALDKVLDFRNAVAQAQQTVRNKAAATALVLVGLFVEVFMSAGVVSGIADRACDGRNVSRPCVHELVRHRGAT